MNRFMWSALCVGLWAGVVGAQPQRGVVDVLEGREGGEGFGGHLSEAIELNRARREGYAARSGGATRSASNRLIFYERVSRLAAGRYDRRARRFNALGIGVVRDDFESMEGVLPAETPPRYRRRASRAERRLVRDLVKEYDDALEAHVEVRDYAAAAALTAEVLERVHGLEEEQGVHWAMTVHVLEQIGVASLNGLGYLEQGRGLEVGDREELAELIHDFVCVLNFNLPSVVGLDDLAQKGHEEGVGVIVNDVPAIPFLERYRVWSEEEPGRVARGDVWSARPVQVEGSYVLRQRRYAFTRERIRLTVRVEGSTVWAMRGVVGAGEASGTGEGRRLRTGVRVGFERGEGPRSIRYTIRHDGTIRGDEPGHAVVETGVRED